MGSNPTSPTGRNDLEQKTKRMVDFNKNSSTELVKRPDSDLETFSRSFRSLQNSEVMGVFWHVCRRLSILFNKGMDWTFAKEFDEEINSLKTSGHPDKARKMMIQKEAASKPRKQKALIGVGLLAGSIYYFGLIALVLPLVLLLLYAALSGSLPEAVAKVEKTYDTEGMEPFSLNEARTAEEAQECLRRALVAEGISIRSFRPPVRYDWGWEIPVILKKGTPSDVMAKADRLETLMMLQRDGMLVSSATFRAEVIIRLIQSDPFLGMEEFAYAEPLSRSINKKYVAVQRMDGKNLELSLLRSHAVIIAGPGGGKSMFMRTLADITTSSRDCVTWDIDPGGNGLEVFGDAIDRRGRTKAEIEQMFTDAIAFAKRRAKLLTKLGMGDNWQPSKKHPAIVIFVDEFIQLDKRAKELAIDLIRIGRKAAISVVLAAQQATRDTLGAAIADSVSLKIMFASRHADVPLVFGEGSLGQGWRPDRLHPATGDDPEDAGKCYIMGGGSREPYLYKAFPMSPAEAIRRGKERASEGMTKIDSDTTGESFENSLLKAIINVFVESEQEWLPTSSISKDLKNYGYNLTVRQIHETLGELGRESQAWEDSKYKVAGYSRDSIEMRLE
ncbi:FtsK-like DNA translocase [Streptomyces phage Coruscant]|uniref:FtsK-like DNA translocase n=1 Tax=Streptomyces phage Coruscant TaxID=2739834 RepID=A0A7G4AW43_9CAUD|nr:FtsK/SpoIIIE-like protein [Streptomyces phage Coruscant]QMP84233.1 FtsK-like DNA translocase [Streptomyces phage Coruscant]